MHTVFIISRIMHTPTLSSAVASIGSVLSHLIFLIIIKYCCSYIPFVSTWYSSPSASFENWKYLRRIHISCLCTAKKEHVVIQFGPPINVAAFELSIFLILTGQIKIIGEYNCHPVGDHVFLLSVFYIWVVDLLAFFLCYCQTGLVQGLSLN